MAGWSPPWAGGAVQHPRPLPAFKVLVDTDCVLAKELFGLKCDYRHMSPVIIPRGYTTKFLRGQVHPILSWHLRLSH